jgi:hypothetical protein
MMHRSRVIENSGFVGMRQLLFLSLAIALCATGCRKDFKAIGDQHVRKDFLDKHEKREALAFFEKNGTYFDMDNTTHVDREIVVPLLKRLHEIAPTEQWVVLKPGRKNSAYALLVQLPRDAHVVDRMADAVQEADDRFSGFILQQWGHEWLLMNLIDQKAYEYLKQDRPNIDKQR